MRGLLRLTFLASTALFLACDGSTGPGQDAAVPDLESSAVANGSEMSASGSGHYLLAGTFDIRFFLNAEQDEHGNATGRFRQSLIFDGSLIDFSGEVTCLAVDSENGRAWIGGVLTVNRSEHPDFTTDINEPGDDVWFRVLDTGEGAAEPDRSTFMGFEGAAGIITSEEYCEAKIWPDDNARTHPVTRGSIRVSP